jgi:predicted ATPase/class 3 adenylate cyclase/DNA-binding CsgD family transcriptional regulator
MSALPAGAVTFLFSDIEGSTRLVKALRERYAEVLAEHRRQVRAAIAAHGGREVDTQGDAFFVAFGGAKQAVLCALDIQRVLAAHPWPDGAQVRVRIGIHTGQAVPAEGGYTGLAVHRAARICAAASGGQVLISQATRTLIEDEEETELGFTLVDMGERRLKDLDRPVRLFQLAAAGLDTPSLPGMVLAARDAGSGAEGEAAEVHGLPVALTNFIGRDEPVREVAGLLDKHRLVTVTGPGGSGKTRLAGEVARQVAARFADGAWLAELAPVHDAGQVPAVLAAALGVRDLPGVPVAEALARALARRQLLLVLDNCGHVIGAAAELCARLLSAADDVKILATSREPLAAAGEARYRLAPLALPDLGDLAATAGAEAVALFADRARNAEPRFVVDEQTSPAVARLVRRLDGMPLAIELAAAWVAALGVTGLLRRLGDRFALWTGGNRTAPSRQRSLAAMVEWSYQLLDDRERRVFRQLSVFPGPFTPEGADAVAGAGAETAVLRLADCSLVSPPQPGPDGRSRYMMLDTLRAYGAGLLARAGEDDTATAALAAYALEVAEEAAAGLRTSTADVAAAGRLDAEDATMRQALAWARDHDEATGLRLAVALAPWWLLRGRLAEGRPLLGEAADRAAVRSEVWCAAHFWLGQAAWYSADMAGALDHLTTVRDAFTGRPPRQALADCLAARTGILSSLGRRAEAVGNGRRAVGLARQLGYPSGERLAMFGLTQAAFDAGDLHGALELARQAEQIPADIPGRMARNWSCLMTGLLAAAGDLAAAETTGAAGLARARETDDLRASSELLNLMAEVNLRSDRAEDAAAHLREALQIGSGVELLNSLYVCGGLCAATGRRAEALTVWAAYAANSRRAGLNGPSRQAGGHREALRSARQALGPGRARAAEERGAAMNLATVAEYALMLAAPGPQQPDPTPGIGNLSARERELVTLVAQGRTDAQIAEQLYIGIRAVRSHLDRIRDKTGCRRRADLTRLALSAELV